MPATKDKNGTWMSRFYYVDYQGNRLRTFKRGFKTKRDALEYEREFLSKYKFEVTMTFKSLYELYIDDLSHRLREYTIINKKYIIEIKILSFFKNMKLNDITPVIVRKWQNELLKAINPSSGNPYSQTYIKTIHNQLTAIFNYAIKFHSLQENPCHKAGSIGKKHAEEMNIWTPEEFKLFIETLKDHPAAYAGFNILFWCGLRVGELLALEIKDINFENETLNINKSYQRLNKEDVITEPKTPKSKRIIEMPSQLIPVLKDYLKTLYKPKPSTRLIPHTKYIFEHAMKKYSEIAGVKKIRIHDLRHSHASLLIHLGVNPLTIARRLGHEKVETTLNTYSHLFPNSNKEMMELLKRI